MQDFRDGLKDEERVSFELRGLFERFGYKKVKVRKFEDYSLYLDNKNFLKSDNIITFMDLDGKLLALRPDVTLSIVKNLDAGASASFEKLYYAEKVYRLSRQNREYKEISQMGLECIGPIDGYAEVEVVALAAKSLAAISPGYLLDVSHMGFLSGLLDELELDAAARLEVARCIRAKNRHELERLLELAGLPRAGREALARFPLLCGRFGEALRAARPLARGVAMRGALDELEALYAAFENTPLAGRLNLDFSIINDLDYYNGVIFQGYIEGVPRAVLSGGRYDNLLRKFGKERGAIGFAVYLDELEHYYRRAPGDDADVLVLYGPEADRGALLRETSALAAQGKRVRVERERPQGFRCPAVLRFAGGRLTEEGGEPC